MGQRRRCEQLRTARDIPCVRYVYAQESGLARDSPRERLAVPPPPPPLPSPPLCPPLPVPSCTRGAVCSSQSLLPDPPLSPVAVAPRVRRTGAARHGATRYPRFHEPNIRRERWRVSRTGSSGSELGGLLARQSAVARAPDSASRRRRRGKKESLVFGSFPKNAILRSCERPFVTARNARLTLVS